MENWVVIMFFVFIAGFLIGAGVVFKMGNHLDSEMQSSAIKTCEYANNLTTIVNRATATLELCTNQNYTRLTYLDCSLLGK
jgi:hypothetical protein